MPTDSTIEAAVRPAWSAQAARFAGGVTFVVAVVGAAIVWLTLPQIAEAPRRDVTYLMLLACGVTAVIACLRGAGRVTGRQRTAWLCIGATCAVDVAALVVDAMWIMVNGRPLATPSLQGWAPLLSLPFAAVASVCLLSSYIQLARLRTLVDGLMLGAAAYYVVWLSALRSIVTATGAHATLTRVLLLGPPMGDTFYLVVVLAVLLRTAAGQRSSIVFLFAGVAATTFGDTLSAFSQVTRPLIVPQPFDVFWMAAYLCVALAALRVHPIEAAIDAESTRLIHARSLIPNLAVGAAAAMALAAMALGHQIDPPLIMTTSVMVLLLTVRQTLVLRENIALTADLQRRSDDLHASELRYRGLVQHSSDVTTVLDQDGVITYVSQAVKGVLGVAPERLMGVRLNDLVHEDDRTDVQLHLEDIARRRGDWPVMEFRLRHADGAWRDIEAIPNNLLDDESVHGIVLSARDVTDRRVMEHQLRQQAFHDSLTGLANRALLRERLEHALARCGRSGESVALLFIDLDDFKVINDKHGHAAGDIVLRAIAHRVRGALRSSDTPARLGGDEFAVLLEGGVNDHSAAMVAQRILDDVAQPILVAEKQFTVGISVGISLGGAHDSADNLLRQADVAMYRAKAGGKGDYALFHSSMDLLSIARLQFEVELEEALVKKELVVHYQPIVDLATGDILGNEALVRWLHPSRGLLPPSEFIGLAEESGQVVDIGRNVLAQACAQTMEWRTAFGRPLSVSVNLSSRHFRGQDVVGDVTSVLRDTGLSPSALVLEVTESTLLSDIHDSRTQMAALKRLGVRIALDDFGTGYSSLGYLRELPVDILKIDRSFVVDLGKGERPSDFIRAITTLGRSLELTAIAEGVEQAKQAQLLRTLGVDSAQGYHFARPADAAAIAPLLERGRVNMGRARAAVRVSDGGAPAPRRRRVTTPPPAESKA